jgi:hypothetical protein
MVSGFAPAQLKYAVNVSQKTMELFDSKMVGDKFTINVHEAMTNISLDIMYTARNA